MYTEIDRYTDIPIINDQKRKLPDDFFMIQRTNNWSAKTGTCFFSFLLWCLWGEGQKKDTWIKAVCIHTSYKTLLC